MIGDFKIILLKLISFNEILKINYELNEIDLLKIKQTSRRYT
jgi:hypothetical protein